LGISGFEKSGNVRLIGCNLHLMVILWGLNALVNFL